MDLARCYEILTAITTERHMAPVETLTTDETEAILDLARVAAHSVERKAAPLVSYSVGLALAEVDRASRLSILEDLIAAIEDENDEGPAAA